MSAMGGKRTLAAQTANSVNRRPKETEGYPAANRPGWLAQRPKCSRTDRWIKLVLASSYVTGCICSPMSAMGRKQTFR